MMSGDAEHMEPVGGGPNQPRALSDTSPTVLKRPGVLVVDDEARMRMLLRVALRDHGFTVFLADGGQEALQQYARHGEAIDVVLLDVCMPGQDGPETLDVLRTIDPQVRCCFLSAPSTPYTGGDLIKRGAAHVFARPLEPGPLVQALWSLVLGSDHAAERPPEVVVAPEVEELPHTERRAFVRYPCDLEHICRPVGQPPGAESWRGRVLDISTAGVRLLLDRQLEVGTVLVLGFPRSPQRSPRTLMARVVRAAPESDGEWSLGCTFTRRISEEDLRSLLA
jgi:CheY-like chemotaxis protein